MFKRKKRKNQIIQVFRQTRLDCIDKTNSDDDDDDEDDENPADADSDGNIKGLIAEDSDSDENDEDQRGNADRKQKKKKRRKRRISDRLDEDDIDLIEENIGIKGMTHYSMTHYYDSF